MQNNIFLSRLIRHRQRLDRSALVNEEFLFLYPNAILHHLTSKYSNHRPIKEGWNKEFKRSKSFILSQKIKSTKGALKRWNKKELWHN